MAGHELSTVFLILSSRDMIEIVKYLLDKEVVSLGELAQALEVRNKATLRKRLARLVEGNIVNRVGKGKYRIPNQMKSIIREFISLSGYFLTRDKWVIKDGVLIPFTEDLITDFLSPYELPKELLSKVSMEVAEALATYPYPYIEWELAVSLLVDSLYNAGLYDLARRITRNKMLILDFQDSPMELCTRLKDKGRFKAVLNSFRDIFYSYIFSGRLEIDKYSSPWEIERVIIDKNTIDKGVPAVSHEVSIDLSTFEYTDLRNILRGFSDIDCRVISLCTPPDMNLLHEIDALWTGKMCLIMDLAGNKPVAKSRSSWKRLYNLIKDKDVILSNSPGYYVFSDGLSIPLEYRYAPIYGGIFLDTDLLSREVNLTGLLRDFISYLSIKKRYESGEDGNTPYYSYINIKDILERPVSSIRAKAEFIEDIISSLRLSDTRLEWLIYGDGKRRFTGKVNLEVDWMFKGGCSPMTYRVLDEDDLMMAVTQLTGTGYRYIRLLW